MFKRVFILFGMLALLSLACGTSTITPAPTTNPAVECQAVWNETVGEDSTVSTSLVIDTIMNKEWAKATKGYFLKSCLESGWYPKK